MNELTLTEAFELYHAANPRPFSEADWMAFAGCDGEPYIAHSDDYTFIFDVGTEDAVLQVFRNDDECTMVANYRLVWEV
ncbi:MAG: hypothetical protein AMS18_10305 [Gemmatimonas sp. SG8_17]|nr:MAG: hypothetical protein AMS18_10305 [Gemmatimonas sp. SG8_17]